MHTLLFTCNLLGTHGTVQLIGGLIPEEGTVQVCVNGAWNSVCDSSCDYKDAYVVCQQLGYPATGENDGGPRTVSSVSAGYVGVTTMLPLCE